MSRQTRSDWEHILVDDASRDDTVQILRAAAAGDSRLVVESLARNLGPAGALQHALRLVRGEYVAVLDHDDEFMPDKLMLQAAYLDAHPAVGIVGAGSETVYPDGRTKRMAAPSSNAEALMWRTYRGMPFRHAALLIRTDVLRAIGGYDPGMRTICDFDMVIRASEHALLGSIPSAVSRYHRSDFQVSTVHQRMQNHQAALRIYSLLRSRLGIELDMRRAYEWYLLTRRPLSDIEEAEEQLQLLEQVLQRHIAWRRLLPADEVEIMLACAQICAKAAWVARADAVVADRMRSAARQYCATFDIDRYSLALASESDES